MKKVLGLVAVLAFFALGSAQVSSTATSQTMSALDLTVTGTVGDQTEFSAPRAVLTLESNAVINGQSFTLRIPITNRTDYPVEVAYVGNPSFAPIATVSSPANNILLQSGATHFFDFGITINDVIPATINQTFSQVFSFKGTGKPNAVGTQSF